MLTPNRRGAGAREHAAAHAVLAPLPVAGPPEAGLRLPRPPGGPRRAPVWTLLVIASVVLVLSAAVVVGPDTMWLVTLGDVVLRTGSVPAGIPFAVADTSGWAAVPTLGALVLSAVHQLGPLALPAAQLLVVLVLLLLVALGARRCGARDGATAAVLAAFVLGALLALGIARAQLLSLLPFAVLLLLLRAESRRPSARIWYLVPLVAVWGNLHGAVLVGVAVAGCYLLAARWRHSPWTATGVLAAVVLVLFANPAGLRTPVYYYGVFTNQTARQKILFWAPLRLDVPFGVLLAITALLLVALAVHARRPAWEYLALAGLTVATLSAARNGIWLGLFTVAPAAQDLTRLLAGRLPRRGRRTEKFPADRPLLALALAGALVVCGLAATLLAVRAPAFTADSGTAARITRLAAGRTILAPEPLAESLAAAGARVWVSDPLDAFSPQDQAAYIDFLLGTGRHATHALDHADLVVVTPGSPQATLAEASGFSPIATIATYDIAARSR